MIEGRE